MDLGTDLTIQDISSYFKELLKDDSLINDNNKDKIYYNYFSKDELFNTLKPLIIIFNNNIIDDIINIIIDFYGIFKGWSNNINDKFGNVNIYESNDKYINYALFNYSKKPPSVSIVHAA